MTFSEGTFNINAGATLTSLVGSYNLVVTLTDTVGATSSSTIVLNLLAK